MALTTKNKKINNPSAWRDISWWILLLKNLLEPLIACIYLKKGVLSLVSGWIAPELSLQSENIHINQFLIIQVIDPSTQVD